MILIDKEDFEKAILNGKEIKTKIMFYTDELECVEADSPEVEVKNNERLKPGAPYYENGELIGVVAAVDTYVNGSKKTIVLSLKDEKEEMTWDEAMSLYKDEVHGWRLPTKEEFALIIANVEEINQSLENNNGEPLDGWYWSSTSSGYDTYYCIVHMSDGRNGWSYVDFDRYVRPVLAF